MNQERTHATNNLIDTISSRIRMLENGKVGLISDVAELFQATEGK